MTLWSIFYIVVIYLSREIKRFFNLTRDVRNDDYTLVVDEIYVYGKESKHAVWLYSF
jgi:hypothetical protein